VGQTYPNTMKNFPSRIQVRIGFLVLSLTCVLPVVNASETIPGKIAISAIPGELTILNTPTQVRLEKDGSLYLAAPGKTNLFNPPAGSASVQSAPMVLFEAPKAGFVLMAKVSGSLKEVYDVAALVVYQDNNTWAKLCYENSVAKEPTIVSVVTRTISDDCNSQSIASDHAFLAIARKGSVYTFNYSPDGKNWRMIRHFNLATTGKLMAGFAVHDSRGEGFAATFSQITYIPEAPESVGNLPPITQ